MEHPSVDSKLERHPEIGELLFDSEKLTLLLNVFKNAVNASALAELAKQQGLLLKSEFHITIIGSDTGEAINEKLSQCSDQQKAETILKIKELADSINWQLVAKPEYYYITKEYADDQNPETRKSYVQLFDLIGLTEFYERLNKLLGLNLVVPLPHVTIFTTSTNPQKQLRGIGIYSAEQFKGLGPQKLDI